MCMQNCANTVEKLLGRKRRSFIAYKVLKRTTKSPRCIWEPPVTPDVLRAPYKKTPFKIGCNISNSDVRKPCLKHNRIIKRGIHVFLQKKYANREAFNWDSCVKTYVVVPVKVNLDDLIAAKEYRSHAVFRKIHISATAYKKALA
jgi:hypothetical protein